MGQRPRHLPRVRPDPNLNHSPRIAPVAPEDGDRLPEVLAVQADGIQARQVQVDGIQARQVQVDGIRGRRGQVDGGRRQPDRAGGIRGLADPTIRRI